LAASQLPFTGADLLSVAIAGLLLVATGTVIRRRFVGQE